MQEMSETHLPLLTRVKVLTSEMREESFETTELQAELQVPLTPPPPGGPGGGGGLGM
jgi:hypothetical protein